MLTTPVETMKKYIDQPSGTHDKADVAQMADIIKADFESLGFAVETVPGKEFGPTLKCKIGKGKKQLLLMGHMDTVFPHDICVPYTPVEGTIVKGSGINDMKGGVVIMLYALKEALTKINLDEYSICAVINPDEEVGSIESADTILAAAKESFAALSFEPNNTNNRIICSRKGVISAFIKCVGIPGHAGGQYKECASAVQALAAHITKLYTLRDDTKDTSFNCGVFKGGTAENVIAETAEAACEFRYYDEALKPVLKQKVLDICAETPVPGVTTTVTWGASHPACDINEKSQALLDIALSIAAKQGRVLCTERTGGAGDISIAALAGIGVIDGLGMVGAGAHTSEEWGDMACIPTQIEFAVEMMLQVCK
ncbi:MAG: M20/M25/M40 family metallo-hydrolase [Clostridia bacterium]|nr:M20/M25/M40 family metallo-hydrolase [Clostridia bacterium]